ncbi:MAG: HAD family hydrolase [Pseudonocardiales bacterium]|nr:HAD family hydrolase [Pseudonocardiales bacterium]
MTEPAPTLALDVDGTLVDTNYHHALSWYRAFRGIGVTLPVWRLHRAIGMGGDKLVAAVAGDEVESEYGDEVREAHTSAFDDMLGEVAPLPGARELLEAIVEHGYQFVLSTSAQGKHVEHYLDLLGARELAAGWTTSDDVEESKPEPDLIEVALAKVGARRAVMVGDSTWDSVAAGKLGLPSVAVRSGGFGADELTEAGATTVYESLDELREDLDALPFGQVSTAG